MRMLYVGKDKMSPDFFCPGSTVCMSLTSNLQDEIEIQDTSILRNSGERFPDWLNGTPILIDTETNLILRGTQAVRYLQALPKKKEQPKKEKEKQRTPAASSEKENVLQEAAEEERGGLDASFQIESVDQQEEVSSGKVSEADLKEYMRKREQMMSSPQGPPPSQMT